MSLERKIASVKEQQRLQVDSLGRQIARAQRSACGGPALLSIDGGIKFTRKGAGWRPCNPGWRRWKQHHLEQNGYASHQEWLADWQDARSDEFFVLGSRDETAGCQLCVATVADDGTLTLRLRMPDCLAGQHGKYLIIEGYSK